MSTFKVDQDGPVNALALNRDNTQVAIGGRNVFKVYQIENDGFKEICNLRASKHLNLSFSCNDVAWSSTDDNYLATAATNGHVCVWNLTKMGKAMQEQVYQEHKRTVNKVNFHASEPNRLISGSQDGTMRYFDIRCKAAVAIFYSNTESVRDVQFSPHTPHSFAAVSENGSVQLWDVRRTDKCQQQFTAHSGPVFACDWHPDSTWLATASRDKTIKVWDLSSKPTLEYTIHTIASIGHVKWRPQRKYHIASCALVVDCSINVWDVRRPYIPFASFNEHKDIASGVAWRGDPHVFLSTGRDCSLYQHSFKEAFRPASKANPQGMSLNNKDDILYACRIPATPQSYTKAAGLIVRKTSTTTIVSENFHQASSVIHQFRSTVSSHDSSCFALLATRYKLTGPSFSEICEHNAMVAKDCGKSHVSVIWRIIKTMYGEEFQQNLLNPNNNLKREEGITNQTLLDHHLIHENEQQCPSGVIVGEDLLTAPLLPPLSTVISQQQQQQQQLLCSATGSEEDNTTTATTTNNTSTTGGGVMMMTGDSVNEDQVDHHHHHSQSLYSNGYHSSHNSALPRGDFSFGENELDMELDKLTIDYRSSGGRGTNNHLLLAQQHQQQQEWTLPNEAFYIRHEIADRGGGGLTSNVNGGGGVVTNTSPVVNNNQQPAVATTIVVEHNRGNSRGTVGNNANSGSGSGGNVLLDSHEERFRQQSPTTMVTMDEQLLPGLITVSKIPSSISTTYWDPSGIVCDALLHHASMGDIQTASSVLTVLGAGGRRTLSLDETVQEQWLLGYVELLGRCKLWNVATQIIKLSWLPAVHQLNQQSTRINSNCGECGKALVRSGWRCERCDDHTMTTASSTGGGGVGVAVGGGDVVTRAGGGGGNNNNSYTVAGSCSVCHQVVRGLYVWCQGCAHGGHLIHMQQWLSKYKQCPTGCGHLCEYR